VRTRRAAAGDDPARGDPLGYRRGMTQSPTVAVRGEVTREVDPEIAEFSVTVSARDRSRRDALARLAARLDAVRAVLDEYPGAVEKRETAGLFVRPEVRGKGERVSAYSGNVSTTVTVRDFAALGEIMLRLADLDQSSLAGPWWQLRPGSPVHAQARRDAVDAAVRRAREYAEALGARIDGLVELTDAGLSRAPQPLAAAPMMRLAAGVAADTPQLDLEPARQTVYAQVEARFAITEPTALAEPVD
jgi:uncharacterized protein YggE